jgi:hypothetical protein
MKINMRLTLSWAYAYGDHEVVEVEGILHVVIKNKYDLMCIPK